MSGLLESSYPLEVMSSAADEVEFDESPNLYILNAAISACEKGGAWIEALQLYENFRAREQENATRPNFITVNSLLIALENAGQMELAESIYEEALRDRIVKPMKRRVDNDGSLQRMLVCTWSISTRLLLMKFVLTFTLVSLARIYTSSPLQWRK
jgi:pentatricopeptide repeat protein